MEPVRLDTQRDLDPDRNREEIIALLNVALATEMVCMLRYRRHYYTAKGIDSESVKDEFLEHSNQEFEHSDWLAERIEQLGGSPEYDPQIFRGRSDAEYSEASGLKEMIRDNLEAERTAIETYRGMIDQVKEKDPTTRRVLENILAAEEEHASDLIDLLGDEPGPKSRDFK
jgi:bacterioferritin